MRGELVMVNFMCQLEWATRCADKALFPGVSMTVFLDEISISVSGPNKVDYPLQCCWASFNPLRV